MMDFVDLHAHTTYSYGDGYATPRQHVNRLKKLGRTHACFSEHGNVSSWVALEVECEKAGLEPIFGIEIYVGIPGERRKTHMILLAMNLVGLQNINRIVTKSYQQFYQWPTVYWEDLKKYNEGVIALSGCADSALSCILLGGKYFGDKSLESTDAAYERAVRGVRRFQKVFGDRYYLEVQRFPGLERTCVLNPLLAQISRDTGAQLCATSDVHYTHPDQNAIQRILHAAHRGGSVESADATWEYGILLTYPQSDLEILTDLENTGLAMGEAADACMNTRVIAERCTGTRLPKAPPPKFPIEGNKSAETLLREWITLGWNRRLEYNTVMQANKQKYKERMRHEYETICAREGFADYFLIVSDLVTWAKAEGIAVGPGRGSAAGSLVCYLLHITEVDSLQFPMLFERFLDETRTDPPDIDIDFEDERRDEVFAYAATKYGSKHVGNILNITRYLGRSALDDVARVYRIPSWKVDAIKGKLLQRAEGHPRFSKSLEDTFDTFPEIAEIVSETPELNYAARLEGNVRGFNVHAAGMVILGEDVELNDICATYEREIDGQIRRAIPYDKRDAQRLGLLKIDALSLITMGEIANVCRMAGMTLDELYRIPLDDNETLQAFRDGDVLGIFQFEGGTTRRILKAVQPTKFMHLADVNALARPGADDKGYIRNKNAGTWDEPVSKIIAAHTDWTYGVVVYEEQILMILRDLGGFAPAELNRMRKIIHDKLGGTAFNENYRRFVKGCAAHGLSEDAAKSVWDGMVSASGYAFNIGHSVPYAAIGYWQQYLKIHATAEFYTSKLNKCSDNVRRGKLIQEAGRHRVEVSPPRLLESERNWTLVREPYPVILAGFDCIDGIGPVTASNIINWRTEQQDMLPIDDFYPEWEDLKEVKGIGPKTISKIIDFTEATDPFGVEKTSQILNTIRSHITDGRLAGIPAPTHISIDVPPEKTWVTYVGIVRKRKYYDAVEQAQKRATEDISREEILADLERPDLLKYAALYVEDEYGEQIRLSVSRWAYPKFAKEIQNIKANRDVVVAQGYSNEWGGISIQVKNLYVLNPHP